MTRVDLEDDVWLAILAAMEKAEQDEADADLTELLVTGMVEIRKAVGL